MRLANIYLQTGELGLAEPLLERSNAFLLKRSGATHPDTIASTLQLATLYGKTGRIDAAKRLFAESEQFAKDLPNGDLKLAMARWKWGLFLASQGEYAKAEPLLFASCRSSLAKAKELVSGLSAAEARTWVATHNARTDLCLMVLRAQGKWEAAEAYEVVWTQKQLAAQVRMRSDSYSFESPEVDRISKQLRRARNELGKLVSATPDPEQNDDFSARLASITKEKERLERQLAAASPTTKRELELRDSTAKDLLQVLPPGVAVIDFFAAFDWDFRREDMKLRKPGGAEYVQKVTQETRHPRYHAFVLRSDRPLNNGSLATWIPLGDAQPIEDAVLEFCRVTASAGITTSNRSLFPKSELIGQETQANAAPMPPSRRLRTMIWDKLEKELEGIHTVIVIPFGKLNLMSWSALPGSQENSFLAEDYAIATASSGQAIFSMMGSDAVVSSDTAMVVGGIDYDHRSARNATNVADATLRNSVHPALSDSKWSSLPFTSSEASLVADSWSDRGLIHQLSETDASEETIASLLPNTGYVHLATHGFFDKAGSVLSNTGLIYKEKGQLPLAEKSVSKALEIIGSCYGADHPDYSNALLNLSVLQGAQGNFVKAEESCRKALAICSDQLGVDHPQYALILKELGSLYFSQSEHQRAAPILAEALERQRAILNRFAIVQSERQQYSQQASTRQILDAYLSNALEMGGDPTAALEAVWAWKGAITTRQRAYRSVVAQDPKLAALFDELRGATGRISTLSKKMPPSPPASAPAEAQELWKKQLESWKGQLRQLTDQCELIERRIASENDLFRGVLEQLTVEKFQQKLPAGVAFLDFLEFERYSNQSEASGGATSKKSFVAFMVGRSGRPAVIEIGESKSIDESIKAFRRYCQSLEFQSDTLAGNRLRELILEPIEAELIDAHTLVVAPDASLSRIPFCALPGSQPGSFLLQNFKVSTVPSAQLLYDGLMRNPADAQESLLVVGDIDYGSAPNPKPAAESGPLFANNGMRLRGEDGVSEFSSLAGFQSETRAVRELFSTRFENPIIRSLEGSIATERNFIDRAREASVIHIVTHGYFADPSVRSIDQIHPANSLEVQLAKDPFVGTYLPGMLSGLAMAGANRNSGNEDGILRAAEIGAASMPQADLVILSACETGLGPQAGGEGITGLQRAFHIAGARSVIASLWQVDDSATEALVREFYKNLWMGGLSKTDALRQAQLEMLRSYDPDSRSLSRGLIPKAGKVGTPSVIAEDTRSSNPKPNMLPPYYWAAFQLSGDWQ